MYLMAPSVLIVDDALFMRMMIKDILSKDGLDVIGEAENGVEAVKKYAELHPDLVTMDIVMPEMDGIEAVRNIMKLDPAARVLMCSAMGQQPLVVEALEAGAKDFIIKPFQPSKVVEAVRKALQGDEE
jgi:two-component system, chemotaxis family, chemotaxis protein CheY